MKPTAMVKSSRRRFSARSRSMRRRWSPTSAKRTSFAAQRSLPSVFRLRFVATAGERSQGCGRRATESERVCRHDCRDSSDEDGCDRPQHISGGVSSHAATSVALKHRGHTPPPAPVTTAAPPASSATTNIKFKLAKIAAIVGNNRQREAVHTAAASAAATVRFDDNKPLRGSPAPSTAAAATHQPQSARTLSHNSSTRIN